MASEVGSADGIPLRSALVLRQAALLHHASELVPGERAFDRLLRDVMGLRTFAAQLRLGIRADIVRERRRRRTRELSAAQRYGVRLPEGGPIGRCRREAEPCLEILDPLPDGRNLPDPYLTAGKVYSDKAESLPAAEGGAWRKRALDALRRGERITASLNEQHRRDDLAHGKPFHPMDLSALYEHLGYVELKDKNCDEIGGHRLKRPCALRLFRIGSSISPPPLPVRTISMTQRSPCSRA